MGYQGRATARGGAGAGEATASEGVAGLGASAPTTSPGGSPTPVVPGAGGEPDRADGGTLRPVPPLVSDADRGTASPLVDPSAGQGIDPLRPPMEPPWRMALGRLTTWWAGVRGAGPAPPPGGGAADLEAHGGPDDVSEAGLRPGAGGRSVLAGRDPWALCLAVVVAATVVVVGFVVLRPGPGATPVEVGLPLTGEGATAPSGPQVPAADAVPGPASAAAPVLGQGPSVPGAPPHGTIASAAPGADLGGSPVVVHVAGAVARPGVHRVGAGARVDDVVAAAGGVLPEADVDRMNLAAPVHDGEKIHVPRRGEEVTLETGGPHEADGGGPGRGPLDLNTASAAQLESLPGIGPATAAAIVAHRSSVGRFSAVDDLIDVRGIGPAKLEQLRPAVTVR